MNGNSHFVILKNEIHNSHKHWEEACKSLSLNYSIVELSLDSWIDELQNYLSKNVHFLACPSGVASKYKQMYDERIYIISKVMKQKVFPSYESIVIHENKRLLSYWLKANGVPHPDTNVFYSKQEAYRFIENCSYPQVVKTNIGASGNGVQIIRSSTEAKRYIRKAFSRKGIRQKTGPNLKMGDFKRRFINFVKNKEHRMTRMNEYKAVYKDPQIGFVLFQEFIKHDYEWRIVRIGSAYFGHQKVKIGDKASGTKGINYVIPPSDLLDFVKNICEKYNFFTIAIDLFENPNGGYLVNEMQCVFGHVQDYICAQNDVEGKLVNNKGNWDFVSGIYNQNLSYNERLKQYINQL